VVNRTITIYEHGRLQVGETYGMGENKVAFDDRHFDALVKYNERNDSRFFTVGHQRIKFGQYVGVIAVQDITIEVLPKTDGMEGELQWRVALINMLKVAHGLPLHEAGHAHLNLRNTSVLEHFLRLYTEEVQRLVHQGLVKRYRQRAGISTALKGRLDLPRHIRGSIVHKERFHVIHQVYDTDHALHSILKKALEVVEHVTRDTVTMGLVQDMQWAFEHVADRRITAQTFDRLRLDRKTTTFSDALQLAKLILLNYAPDVQSGREHILSLLFDMNKLFEVVVLKLLQRVARQRADLTITGQNSREFWNGQRIRPDIIIAEGEQIKCIIDTKWKLPKDDRPADADLKQMYVYNRQYGSAESVLLYPGAKPDNDRVDFDEDHTGRKDHGCSVRFIELFNGEGQIQLERTKALLATLIGPAIVVPSQGN
jgi:5-methylcytosine-specific restriction enzyme subunit McrC